MNFINPDYIALHIYRYEQKGNQNSLSRIASHIDMPDLTDDGELTPEQMGWVLDFIQGFKSQSRGQEAIEQAKRLEKWGGDEEFSEALEDLFLEFASD